MAAVTITATPRRRMGPTTRPHRPVTRVVYLRRRVTAVLLGMVLVLVMAQAGTALGGSTLAAPERRPAVLEHTIVTPGRLAVVRRAAARTGRGSTPGGRCARAGPPRRAAGTG